MAAETGDTSRTVDATVTEEPAAFTVRLPAPPPATLVIFGATAT